jgi:hypothetical protein
MWAIASSARTVKSHRSLSLAVVGSLRWAASTGEASSLSNLRRTPTLTILQGRGGLLVSSYGSL